MTSQCPGPRPRLAGRAPPGPREHSQAGRGGGGARTRSGDWGRGGGAQLSSGHSSAVRSARVRRFLPGRAAPLWPGARVDPSLHLSWDSGPVEAALRREERRTVSCRLTVVSARPGDPRPGDREGLNGQTTPGNEVHRAARSLSRSSECPLHVKHPRLRDAQVS